MNFTTLNALGELRRHMYQVITLVNPGFISIGQEAPDQFFKKHDIRFLRKFANLCAIKYGVKQHSQFLLNLLHIHLLEPLQKQMNS